MATVCRANDTQRLVSTCVSDHPDLLAGDNLAANQTVTFLVQRPPRSKMIEALQDLEFILFR